MDTHLTARIKEYLRPYRRRVQLPATIPGMSERTAAAVLAEIGADITRFATAAHLASWAGVCPGNHESAGKSLRRGTEAATNRPPRTSDALRGGTGGLRASAGRLRRQNPGQK